MKSNYKLQGKKNTKTYYIKKCHFIGKRRKINRKLKIKLLYV